MNNTVKSFGICSLIFFLLLFFAISCSKAKHKFKVPNIKIITKENLHGVIASDDSHVWIVGNYGTVYHSDNGGKEWVKQDSGVKTLLVDGSFLNNRIGWIVGVEGTVIHTEDGGKTWTKQGTDTKRHLFSISFVDNDFGWAAGEYATIIHTEDGGKSWYRQTEEEDRIYNNICFVDRKNGWAVGEYGTIMHTSDGGATWKLQVPESFKRETFEERYENPPPTLFGVYFTDVRNGWACGLDATIIHTSDGGKTWDKMQTEGIQALYTVFIKDGRGWAVGNKGTYLKSDDGGMVWKIKEEAIKTKQWLRDVYFSTPEDGWVVGAAGTVVHTEDGGESWNFYSGLSYEFEGFEMPEALEKRVIE